jgi:arginyl-tRNA synthetase
MEAFYASLLARYRQVLGLEAELPEGGYQGDYVTDVAREMVEQEGQRYLQLSTAEALGEIAPVGRQKMVDVIRDDLQHIGVEFDNWFSEGSLYRGDEYETAMELLRSRGYVAEDDGAIWFASTALGQDKDNVLVRSNGSPTYFASDVAYHYNKFARRGFRQVIDIWGADHQGHVPRMKAAMEAMDIDPDRLTIMISQMVTLKRGDETVRASKRTGEFVTLRELVDEVGSDACRYNFLARTPNTQMDFDMEMAKKEGMDNPVYYLQYGYSRIASILNNAREREIDWSSADVSLLQHPAELALIRKLLVLPELVENMARNLEPHHLPHYTLELATAFHSFYENCRVLSSEPADHEIMLARLKLTEAAHVTVARCLDLMGMSAPERM